jgi:hypothetical protein
MNENELRTALHNLERRLAAALNNAQAAQDDLNRVRMLGSLPPIQYFLLSAAIAEEPRVGPRGVVKLSDQDGDEIVNLILDSARFRRGEVTSVAEARRQRLSAEKDKRR